MSVVSCFMCDYDYVIEKKDNAMVFIDALEAKTLKD
jgi:hypothetical protein